MATFERGAAFHPAARSLPDQEAWSWLREVPLSQPRAVRIASGRTLATARRT